MRKIGKRETMKKLLTLGTIAAVMSLLLVSPVIAQEDRSSDTSFEFAGKAEYNRSGEDKSAKESAGGSGSSKSGSSKAGSSKSSSPKTLPETGGVPLLVLGGGVFVIGGGLLVRRSFRR